MVLWVKELRERARMGTGKRMKEKKEKMGGLKRCERAQKAVAVMNSGKGKGKYGR